MIKISLFLFACFFILGLFFSGCTTVKCDEFCSAQKHAQCVGYFESSGEHPNCKCKYICDKNIINIQNSS